MNKILIRNKEKEQMFQEGLQQSTPETLGFALKSPVRGLLSRAKGIANQKKQGKIEKHPRKTCHTKLLES